MRVKATREGLIGDITSSGWRIDAVRFFVALPDTAALHRWVRVTNPLNGRSCRAEVLDVGPWNISDSAYVFGGLRPLSEAGYKVNLEGKTIQGVTNRAGIDLGEAVYRALAMEGNTEVDWDFDDLSPSTRPDAPLLLDA